MPMFDAALIYHPEVDKYSTIIIDQNHYSVPDNLVGEQIMADAYSNRLVCRCITNKIAEHRRLTVCREWRLEQTHYLNTLKKKSDALTGSLAIQQAAENVKKLYETYLPIEQRTS